MALRHDPLQHPHEQPLLRLPFPPLPPPAAYPLGKAIRHAHRETQHLAHLAERRFPPVGDHVRRHRRAPLPVFAEHMLDHLLPPFPRGKINVDVRPALPVFRKEPLEKQAPAHRIHRRDPQRIAHHGVRPAAPPLAQDSPPPRKLHQLIDDQEIPLEAQPLYHRQLVLQLRLHLATTNPVSPRRPRV